MRTSLWEVAEELSRRFTPQGGPPVNITLDLDPICNIIQNLHPGLLTFSLGNMPPRYHCFHSALACAYAHHMKKVLPVEFLPRGINLHDLSLYLPMIGLGSFPVYYFDPQARPPYSLYSGAPRIDNYCLLFIPQNVLLGVPAAHLTFAQLPASNHVSNNYVLFSNLPPFENDNCFWHAPCISTEFRTLQSIGRACLCAVSPCEHDQGFSRFVASFNTEVFYHSSFTHCLSIVTHTNRTTLTPTKIYDPLLPDVQQDYTPNTDRLTSDLPQVCIMYRGGRAVLSPYVRKTQLVPKVGLVVTSSISWILATCAMLRLPDYLHPPTQFDVFDHFVFNWKQKFLGSVRSYLPKFSFSSFSHKPIFRPESFVGKYVSVGTNYLADLKADLIHAYRVTYPKPKPDFLTFLRLPFTRFHPVNKNALRYSCFLYGSMGALTIFGLGAYVISRYRRQKLNFSPVPVTLPAANPHFDFTNSNLGNYIRVRSVGIGSDRAALRVIARRGMQELNYPDVPIQALDEWLETLSAPILAKVGKVPPGCLNCLTTKQVHRRLCKGCKLRLRYPFYWPQLTDNFVFVGIRPIVIVDPKAPLTPFANDVSIHYKGRHITSMGSALEVFHREKPPPRSYGHSNGPIIYFCEATVYPSVPATTLVAMAARMAVDPPYLPANPHVFQCAFDLLNSVMGFYASGLIPYTHQQIIQKLAPAKKKIYQSALTDIEEGIAPPISSILKFKAFSKLEKAIVTRFDHVDGFVDKPKRVPRLINSPKPHLNVYLAPFVSAFVSHIKTIFTPCSNLYYASGATPEQLDQHMRFSWAHSLKIIEDDVSFMDLSQSEQSLTQIARLVHSSFDNPPDYLLTLLLGQIHLKIKTKEISAYLGKHNASGIPPTTLNNGLGCIVVRVMALCYVIVQQELNPQTMHLYLAVLPSVIESVVMSAGGDDGYLTIRDELYPFSYDTVEFLDLYSRGFAMFGYDVGRAKIRVFGSHNWRLSTFLAMRPYYTESGYCMGPEVCRRLSTAYWKLDSNLHPFFWLNAVNNSFLINYSFVPILRDVALMVHRCIPHLTDEVLRDEFATWTQRTDKPAFHPRALEEMSIDYGFSRQDYDFFVDMLNKTDTPFVHINAPIFSYLFARQ